MWEPYKYNKKIMDLITHHKMMKVWKKVNMKWKRRNVVERKVEIVLLKEINHSKCWKLWQLIMPLHGTYKHLLRWELKIFKSIAQTIQPSCKLILWQTFWTRVNLALVARPNYRPCIRLEVQRWIRKTIQKYWLVMQSLLMRVFCSKESQAVSKSLISQVFQSLKR